MSSQPGVSTVSDAGHDRIDTMEERAMADQRDPEVQRLIDESAIRHLLSLYPRAIDRHDHELLASLYHPGAIDDHGVFNGLASDYVDFIREHSQPDVHWTHHNGTQIIEIEGDVANTETYCIALCRQGARGKDGFDAEIFLRVRYLDRIEKRAGQWKIAHRKVVYSPCHVAPISTDFDPSKVIPGASLLHEGSFPRDLVYNW